MTAKHLFKRGVSGNPSGRPKFSKTKFRFDVAKILEERGCNPFQILADIAMSGKSDDTRARAAAELCSYVAPKLKQIEHTGEGDKPLMITLNMVPRSV